MIIENIIWFVILISPLFCLLLILIIRYLWKSIQIRYLVPVLITIIVLFSIIGLFIVNELSGNQFSESLDIIFSWYWFLLVLSPLIAIGIYLIKDVKRENLILFSATITAIVLAILISTLLVIFAEIYKNPDLFDKLIRNPFLVIEKIMNIIQIMINAAFGFDRFYLLLDGIYENDKDFYDVISRTLALGTPLVFTALVFAVAAKTGLFNIGAEGAFTLGGFVGAVIGVWLPDMIQIPLPQEILAIIHLPLAFLCAAIVGAFFGLIPGLLKAYLGAHEVITTIMLNPIAYLIVFLLVRDYYTVPDLRTETPQVLRTCQLPQLLPEYLFAEYLIAIFIAFLMYFFLFRTTYGLELRATGQNPTAAEYAGIPIKRRQIQAMAIAGTIGAIGGAGMSLGYYYHFHPSHPLGIGFDGIAVSVIGANNPLILILVALLFGAIKNSGETLSTSLFIPKDIIAAMRGLIILFAALPMAIAYIIRRMGKIGKLQEDETTESISGKIIDKNNHNSDYTSNQEDSI